MAVALRSVGVSPGADGTNCIIVKPLGLAEGDLMVAHISVKAPDDDHNDPDTWTKIRHDSDPGGIGNSLWWKIATAGDAAGGSFTFTCSDNPNIGAITAWTGHDPITPINANNGQGNASSTTVTSPEITPSVANCMICLFVGIQDNLSRCSGYAIVNDNPSWDEAYDHDTSAGADVGQAMGYGARPETTATGNGTATLSAAEANTGSLIAIAPPAPPAPVVVTPPTLALSLTTYAPTIAISDNQKVTPSTLALTLTSYAPSINIDFKVIPPTLALNLTTFAPTVLTPRLVTPPTLALILTEYAPVLEFGIIIPTLALTLTTYAPAALIPYFVARISGTGVDILKGSLRVEQRIEERSTAEFTIVDLPGTASYSKGEKVMIYDPDSTLIFGGVIDIPETVSAASSGELLHPIRCADYHYFADKRLVAESYLDKTCGYIVDDIFDKYLDDEGVTIGNIELGATLIEAIFNYVRVTDAYDALAEKAGKIWFIDEHKALYFQSRDLDAAPWTATGSNIDNAKLSGGNPLYRNRQYIRGGRGTTALQTEKFVADGEQNAFTLSFPVAKVPTFVEVNGVDKTPLGIKGLDAPGDFASYWSKGDPTVNFTDVPTAGWIVEIRYYGQFDILTLVEDTDEIASQLAVEGVGTGFVDDIADEPTLIDKDASFDSGLAKLAKYGVIGQCLIYQTVESGLKPGQLQTVTYPALGLDTEMLIESVITTMVRQNVTYNVVAITGPELGSWTNLFKALAAMKGEVIARLNVGTEQILIILVKKDETWGWDELYEVFPAACHFPSATLYPRTTIYPC